MKITKKTTPAFRLKIAVLAIAACFSPLLLANPVGPTVVNGSATFSSNGSTLSVTNTPGAIVNWQQFNIGAGQTTQFIQQSAQSSVLNRVVGPDPSQIMGTLRSNGQVYLINPGGILFGAGAVVDVGGLIASTMNITNADFLMNRMNFNGNNGTSVINQGTITTPFGGSVYLIGNNVTNQGVITTPQGEVVLAAGNSVSMVNTVTPHVSVTVSAPAGGQAINLGQVTAQGGSINIYAPLIKQQGLLSADSATVNAQGQIVLLATKQVDVMAGSTTSATNSNGQGGSVQVLGNQVNVAGSVDVSGSAGGGTVLVGGDFQGKNAAIQNAQSTNVVPGASLKADATLNGNGGKVVVWSDGNTAFYGDITAHGGTQAGNGGNVEVSGKGLLDFKGMVNTLAPNGKGGSLLLDPLSLCIVNTGTCSYTDSLGNLFNAVSYLTPTQVSALVAGNANTTIQSNAYGGSGALMVNSPIVFTTGQLTGGKSLTLQADNGGLMLNGTTGMPIIDAISGGGALNLTLNATGNPVWDGWVHINPGAIYTNGGNFTINAVSDVRIDGGSVVSTAGGNVNITAMNFALGSPATATAPATTGIIGTHAMTTGGVDGNVTINASGMFGPWSQQGTAAFQQSVAAQSGSSINLGANGSLVVNGVTSPGGTYAATTYWAANTVGAPPVSSFAGNYSGTYIIDPASGSSGSGTWTMSISTTGVMTLTATGPAGINGFTAQIYPLANGRFVAPDTSQGTGPNAPQRGMLGSIDPVTGIVSGFWGNNTRTMGVGNLYGTFAGQGQGNVNQQQQQQQQTCSTNPLLCASNTTPQPAQPAPNTTGVVTDTTKTEGNVTYGATDVASPDVKSAMVWISYADVRIARTDARQAESEYDAAINREIAARSAQEKQAAQKLVESKSVDVALKTADARIRETESELRAAEEEVRTAKTTEDRVRAETRKAVAEYKRADATLSKAEAEALQAETEARHSDNPQVKAVAESKRAAAVTRRFEAEARKADVDAKKADTELKQAEAEAKINATPGAKAVVEAKKSELAVKNADAEVKAAAAEARTAKDPARKAAAENKLAAAEVKKAQAEAKQAEVDATQQDAKAKESGSPVDRSLAETKKAEADAKQAEADAKLAKLEEKSAKDPESKTKAEEKTVLAEARQADAEAKAAETRAEDSKDPEVKHDADAKKANADAKKAEVEVKTASNESRRAEAESKRAEAESRRAESEEQVALDEVRRARDEEKSAATPESKYVAIKKIQAGEAKVMAKRAEVAVKRAEAEMKRVEAEVKQAEADVKEAATPEQRTAIEKRIEQKRNEFTAKRSEMERQEGEARQVAEAAKAKDSEYKESKVRRDEMAEAKFAGIDVASMSKNRMQQEVSARHEFLKETLAPALNILKANPQAADLKTCGAGSGDVCIKPTPSILPAYIANAAVDVMPRVQLPVPTPTTSFLPQIQRKVAVVIGDNAYQDPNIPSLNGAINDADEVAGMLKEKMGYDVQVIHNGTRADIVRAINKIADETGSRDSVVVYYAGHGYQMDDTKMGYWIPSDASVRNPENWISNSDINKMLTDIPARQTILVSDSCYSGAFTSEGKITSSMTAGESVQDILAKRSVLVMSSGGEEPVMDEGRDGHSIFAWHLMDKLGKVNQYENGGEIFDAVRNGVTTDAAGIQTPQYGALNSAGHMTGGDYLFEVRKY